ncbi:unnamed protein product [Gemmata massiliana]|uniref:Uncharacterized protein n=1 Tax=Gemmata massiliana TaxID=1210884 RepID=A0A6P2CX61_9BACT|nr:DUF4190 domain-containing protein [Gemmata massiliana]VTR92314.1 unnamed protein product [Gemmata massiliana]
MAEPTQSPTLPSTADATPYVPISWTAVAAAVAAWKFAIALLLLGIFAFISKKPLLMQELLILPVIAVVLSFAARRIIRNSEGTRTGEGLANAAWWASLVLGLGYVAYLFAIDYSVRRDAANEVERWVGQVRDDKVVGAFYTTLPPGQRQGVSRNDTSLIEMRFRDELLMFRNSDLMRLALRNKGEGEFKYDSVGVADWSYKPGAIDCAFSGTVTCPEGKFPLMVQLKGIEGVTASEGGGGGRQWMVVRPQGGGFIQQDKVERTGYGWLLVLLEINGGSFGKGFIEYVNSGPFTQPFAYQGFVVEGGVPAEAVGASRNGTAVLASFVPLGVAAAGQGGCTRHMADHVFKLPGGGEPSSGQKEKFLASWNAQGVFEAGRRLKDAGGGVPDKDVILKVGDTAVEVYLPIEIPIQNTTGRAETARGKVVVACKDPALLAELKARKASAAGEKPTSNPPQELAQWVNIPWRVVRIESDLNPVSMHQASPGGPGGGPPPGMGGGGAGMHGG